MYARLRCGGNLPMLRPGVDRPLRGNCHPLSCAPDNQVRCVFGARRTKNRLLRYGRDIRYRKPPPMVRGCIFIRRRAVPETPSYGTGCIFRAPYLPDLG